MSMWSNVKKHAKSFGVKGFLYGAAAGAAIGVATLLILAIGFEVGAFLGLAGTAATAGGVSAPEVFGYSAGAVGEGLKAITMQAVGFFGGAGAVVGSSLGAIGGATAGCAYGAVTDPSNPLPKVVDAAANKIINKTPQLAKAVAAKVSMQEAASEQLAQQGGVQATPDAPIITQSATMPQKQVASFQERVELAKEPELAVAQR